MTPETIDNVESDPLADIRELIEQTRKALDDHWAGAKPRPWVTVIVKEGLL